MLPDFSKKRIYSTVSISLLSLFVFLITLSVTFDLKEGSLLKAVFDIYYSFLYRYFSISFLPSFWALVPLSLFLMFTAFYNYMNGKIGIKTSPKILPLLVAEYNKYMSSLEFLEEVKEE